MPIVWLVVIVCAIAAVLYGVVVIKRRDRSQVNVIPITKRSKAKPLQQTGQKCSFCKTPSQKLIFYARENGTIVGLCKDCRPKAERQNMLPL
ncbi:hypothetical protein [Paenibacillus assamensis]|uniref:hypothetical protein n=1 Tax=Paenibacillus assamensis TaxID=311244 RepID=UPI00041C39ED|nr:hypothetical protein [Paenibacillus assamensis]